MVAEFLEEETVAMMGELNTWESMDARMVDTISTLELVKRLRYRLGMMPEDSGQSLIEFALVLPLFMAVLLGLFTFGIGFNNWEMMTEATSVGARTLAISRGQTLDPCQTAVQAIEGAAPSLNASNLIFTFSFNGVPYSGVSCSSASTATGAAGNLIQGQTATLNVTYPCSLVVYKTNFAPTCLLHATTTELVQ